MIIDTHNKNILKVKTIYFSSEIVKTNADIVKYFQCKKYVENCEVFKTNTIDLTLSFEEIKIGFSKSTKRYINQAIKKFQMETEIISELDDRIIDDFCLFYDEVANIKNIQKSNKRMIRRLKKNIFLSKAFNDQNLLVWHLFIFDEVRVRLLYSCSLQESADNLKKMIPSANKLLHSEDIKFAKNAGFKVFDFGGISLTDEGFSGISQFKLGFSKNIDESYHFVIGNTMIGRMVLFFYKIKKTIFMMVLKKG